MLEHIGKRSTEVDQALKASSGKGRFGPLSFLTECQVLPWDDRAVQARKSKCPFLVTYFDKPFRLYRFDAELPLEVDDEYWETEGPEKVFQQPPGKPSKIAAFNSYLKLTQIVAYAMRTIVGFPSPQFFF